MPFKPLIRATKFLLLARDQRPSAGPGNDALRPKSRTEPDHTNTQTLAIAAYSPAFPWLQASRLGKKKKNTLRCAVKDRLAILGSSIFLYIKRPVAVLQRVSSLCQCECFAHSGTNLQRQLCGLDRFTHIQRLSKHDHSRHDSRLTMNRDCSVRDDQSLHPRQRNSVLRRWQISDDESPSEAAHTCNSRCFEACDRIAVWQRV